jgi:hypothetical protein
MRSGTRWQSAISRKEVVIMADETVIKEILVKAGVYSWALAQAGSETELIRLFKDGFQDLVKLCSGSECG